MNLKELYESTKSKAIFLFDKEGRVVETYSKITYENPENFSAVTKVVVNIIDNFFKDVLEIEPLTEIIIKTEHQDFYIKKCDEDHILCVLSEGAMNRSLISLSLKKAGIEKK
ncbi:roadblock/LC7 domain-containing protein [Tenacibaculum aestuariivivum]|uniref:roadblock/LC7 domain-containing protein n=1 Tax=Tenacibaculum aestuariivivum TaxID=2006131 RepID=UPI003AB6F26D